MNFNLKKLFEKKALVLMYHRIADIDIDPWQLAVSPQNFEEHLTLLSKKYEVISLDKLLNDFKTKSISNKAITITFDDGYRDNYYQAKPLLEKYQCPATFFIATGYIGMQKQYWWDELETILLHKFQLPSVLAVKIQDHEFVSHLPNNGTLTEAERQLHINWKWPDTPPTDRSAIYLKLWEYLKPLPLHQIEIVLNDIKIWAKTEIAGNESFPMSNSQLHTISEHPLFNIGIHTVTHPALSFHNRHVQYNEMSDCRQYLHKNCYKVSDTVAYPYGHHNADTISIAAEQKFAAAFTTEEQPITTKSHPYMLGRFQVNNWNGEELDKQIYRWFKSY